MANSTYVFNNARGLIQHVTAPKTDTFSSSSSSMVDVTGLSVSITPISSTSKILIIASISGASTIGYDARWNIVRDTTDIYEGASPGSRVASSGSSRSNGGNGDIFSMNLTFVDSPATTSATTYKIQGLVTTGGSFYVNRSDGDTDNSGFGRTASSITVFELGV